MRLLASNPFSISALFIFACPYSAAHVSGPHVLDALAQNEAQQQQQHPRARGARWPRDVINEVVDATEAMQNEYFSTWQGTWPAAIDWTAAVLGTQIPATLSALSAFDTNIRDDGDSPPLDDHLREDLVNTYFSQLISFYYGQDWLALRQQANDDMLWVVLGWLEAINFVQAHKSKHATDRFPWYGENYVPSFAHRARIFWEIASKGWDESLCGGGMIWNPRLVPYKNAITNELYIAASASMYLYFPGDDNDTPFVRDGEDKKFPAHDKKYLDAAIKAYDWLIASDMIDDQGLFVDGFHIDGWRGGRNPSNGTGKCDVRDEQVYTYNQGVILTGQRGLWQATGDVKYLRHAHNLIQDVIKATGWDLDAEKPRDTKVWQGIGRLGVMEERCDILGTCSQDGQTFKGIFFMHYSAFCQPLTEPETQPLTRPEHPPPDFSSVAVIHMRLCKSYASWVRHNAKAVSQTKDDKGLFSMWWTEGLWTDSRLSSIEKVKLYGPHAGPGTDHRNEGIPNDSRWRLPARSDEEADDNDANLMTTEMWRQLSLAHRLETSSNPLHGRRSPEIQSGGLAVLRAEFWHSHHGH